MGYFLYVLRAVKSIYPKPCPNIPPALIPTHPHSVCLCTPSSTSPFLQTRASNTLPHHNHPRSLQEAKDFQCPERTIKGWGPVHFLPEAAVPMGETSLIFSTWSREKENRGKGDSYVLTDQGSSLLKASCFLFLSTHLAGDLKVEMTGRLRRCCRSSRNSPSAAVDSLHLSQR